MGACVHGNSELICRCTPYDTHVDKSGVDGIIVLVDNHFINPFIKAEEQGYINIIYRSHPASPSSRLVHGEWEALEG